MICYGVESLFTWLLLDMIWIKVVVQYIAEQPPCADGCIKINTKHGPHAITMSFIWLYEESEYVYSWCQSTVFFTECPTWLTHPESRCLLN